jgi:MATE family multidrug resistance protein
MPLTTDNGLRAEVRALVALAWPIAVAQCGVVAMGLVDTAVLGRVSSAELAGAAIGRSIGLAAVVPAMGVALAVEPIAAQAVGAGEPARAWQALRTTTRTLAFLSAPLVALAVAATYALVPLGIGAVIAATSRDYLLMQAPGLALVGVSLGYETFLQAHGNTRPALVASIVANVVNLIVCNLLVRGDDALVAIGLSRHGLPRLGAWGAGVAFTIAQVVFLAVLVLAARTHRPAAFAPRVGYRTVLKLGIPVAVQMGAETGVFTLASLMTGRFGPASVAAHQIALNLASFVYIGAIGVAGAAAVRVGHAVGAGISARQRGMVAIAIGAALMSVGTFIFAAFPAYLMQAFTNDSEVIALGARLLVIAAFFQLFDGVQAVASGALRGAGDVRFALVGTIVTHWGVGLPISLFLGFTLGLGVRGIWWGLTAGLVIIAFVLAGRFVAISKKPIARV